MRKNSSSRNYAAARKRLSLLRLGLRLRGRLVRKHLRDRSAVLDVGAADGSMLALLSRQMRFTLGVSLERNPALAELIPENGVCGSGSGLPFRADVFDFVICSATRKHVRDSLGLMKDIARVLKPGGRVILIDPHPFLLKLGRRWGKFDPRYLHHLSSASEICHEFEAAGLEERYRRTGIFVCCVGEKAARSAKGH